MASKSRAAQEKLAELEKDSAPFEDQLVEAARFIGVDLGELESSKYDGTETIRKPKAGIYHGREEWLLKWLLKKLQAQKDAVPRKTPSSWRILCYLIQMVPLLVAARNLTERKFTHILLQTLEEAQKAQQEVDTDTKETKTNHASSSVDEERRSKKRKRSGELINNTIVSGNHGPQDLLAAIFAALNCILHSTKVTSGVSEEGQSAAFSTEYMRSVIRTSAEDSAKILGSWFSLSLETLKIWDDREIAVIQSWLTPFVEIWQTHAKGDVDLMVFSFHCSQPLLSLLRAVKRRKDNVIFVWVAQLDQLVARNVMIPAKAAREENVNSDLLSTLTRISVLQESLNAPILFDVAIRSLQSHGSRRRRPQDETWLQIVFTALKEAMQPQRKQENGQAICDMLQSAIVHKVDLELLTLRSITAEYALPEGAEDWKLLATMIELDANVFLIPNSVEDLLKKLLMKITEASTAMSWPDISEQVVSKVVVPLMNEFAKARDLSGFIRHWYDELVRFEKLRKETQTASAAIFSAWEDDALQAELSKLLEASLTVQQIVQLLDWLSSNVAVNPDAVCVILEAIAGSISGEETVDTVGLRLYHIMFDDGMSNKLDGRYMWRSWRILSRTLDWVEGSDLDEVTRLWEEQVKPFDSLCGKIGAGGLLEVGDGDSVGLEMLEFLRCASAAWSAAKKGGQLDVFAKSAMLDFLQCMAHDIRNFRRDLQSQQELGKESCGSSLNTLYRGIGWMIWSIFRCIFVEYPRTLHLGLELPSGVFREILQNLFWVASASTVDAVFESKNAWLRINHVAFPTLWMSVAQNDYILDRPAVISEIIDVVLSSKSNMDNPLIRSETNNAFAVKFLLQLPLEIFSKRDRERIMRCWPSSEGNPQRISYESAAVDPSVLSLKVKIMHRPTFYEGMKYQDLVHLADDLANSKLSNPVVNQKLFKELVRLTLHHMSANLDQARNRTYVLDALRHYKMTTLLKTNENSKSKGGWNFSIISLFEVVLTTLVAKSKALNDLDIIKSTDLEAVTSSFKDSLFKQLQSILEASDKPRKEQSETRDLSLLSILDALAVFGRDGLQVASLNYLANSYNATRDDLEGSVSRRLESFMGIYARDAKGNLLDSELRGDISTVDGRQSILEKVSALTAGKDQREKLKILESSLATGLADLAQLDKLLAIRKLIISCDDARRSKGAEGDKDHFDLSAAYSILCGHLWKTTGFRQFCLVSETLELMLQTKSRTITQWNIDSTLGSITILCSRNGPALRSNRSGTIYLHLCHFLQAVLTSHRLKLSGHFHLVVQAMQALLRCLFTPLPHSNSKILKIFAPPPWLSSSIHQLGAKHATAYTRLLTLICDPSVSSVTRSQHNNLTSATDKAKRMAGQHMQFVLTTYINLQLEMRMLPEVREKMVPGLYAIFDTTTPELRRAISEGLDASGRAVFGTLFRDYQRFGKWKGS